MPALADLVATRSVLVCCGSGGVGKTTSAAALAVEAARAGRKTCVVTVDPAKRLADALGLAELTNTPARVADPAADAAGGALWALMLDPAATFDETVRRHARNDAQAEQILANRIYQNIARSLSGTQEYMAMEKLFELHEGTGGQRFDLVIVDTPPTRNALDFLDAPRRLTRFIDHRLFKLLTMPQKGALRAVSLATQTFVRSITKVVGGDVVADVLTFLSAFDGMEQGFRDRAGAMERLLRESQTAFVLVASPRRDAVDEALFFAEKLRESGITVEALVVNRVHPGYGASLPAGAAPPVGSDLAVLEANLAQLDAVAEREDGHLAALTARVAPAPVIKVPLLSIDVHDLDALAEVAAYLV